MDKDDFFNSIFVLNFKTVALKKIFLLKWLIVMKLNTPMFFFFFCK